MTPPTLLNLPREIRDIIYNYLHHEILYNWPWSKDQGIDELDVVDMNLENAPSLNALLINKQVHDEYKKVLKSCRFSATIATRPIPKRLAFCRRVSEKHHAETAVSHLRDVNLLVSDHFPEPGFWTIVASFAELLVSKAPRLQTFQVGTKLSSPNGAIHRDIHRNDYWATYEAATHPMFRLEPPPTLLAEGLALAIHGEGYHLGYAKTCRLSKLLPRPGESERDVVQHLVTRVGVYAYARVRESVKLMDKSVFLERWPTPDYPQELLDSLGDERESVRRWPMEVQDWKVTRESEEKA